MAVRRGQFLCRLGKGLSHFLYLNIQITKEQSMTNSIMPLDYEGKQVRMIEENGEFYWYNLGIKQNYHS